jgi:hypothetical protein
MISSGCSLPVMATKRDGQNATQTLGLAEYEWPEN